MLHFLLDNVFIQVGGKVFQQCVDIPMGTNRAPPLAELLLHDYKSSEMVRFSRTNGHPQAKSFEFTRRYIDDLISVNNPRFDKAIEKIYPSELTLKDTTLANGKVAYLDRQIEIRDRQLVMFLYNKRDDFPFAIVLLHFTSCPTSDDVTATLMGVRDWLTHKRYHRRHRSHSLSCTSSAVVLEAWFCSLLTVPTYFGDGCKLQIDRR